MNTDVQSKTVIPDSTAWKKLADLSPDLVFQVGESQRILALNKAAEQYISDAGKPDLASLTLLEYCKLARCTPPTGEVEQDDTPKTAIIWSEDQLDEASSILYGRLPANQSFNSAEIMMQEAISPNARPHLSNNGLEQAVEVVLTSLEKVLPINLYLYDLENICLGNHQFNHENGQKLPLNPIGKKLDVICAAHGLSDEETDRIIQNNQLVFSTARPHIFEESFTDQNGIVHTYISHKTPLYGKNSKPISLIGASVEITKYLKSTLDLKKAHIALKQQRESELTHLKEILAQLPDHVYWKGADGTYLGCNQPYAESLGCQSPKDLVGLTVDDLSKKLGWPAALSEQIKRHDRAVMRNKDLGIFEVNNTVDGNLRTFLSRKKPLLDKHRKTVGIIGISTEITDRKRSEQRIINAKEKVEELYQRQSDFIACISYDLRTALTSILSIAEGLTLKQTDKKSKKLLADMSQVSSTILALVKDILNFSKLTSPSMKFASEPMDFRKLIEDALANLENDAIGKRIELVLNYADTVPRFIISDPSVLRRIVVNLLNYAMEHSEEGGYVSIAVEARTIGKERVNLSLTINDSSAGIPEEKLRHLFNRFHTPMRENNSDQGLGLSVAKQLILGLDGDIEARSQLGEGTTFYCKLPMRPQTVSASQSDWATLYGDVRMLIVDDHIIRGRSFHQHLACENAELSTSTEAISNFNKAFENHEPFDIVVIDDELKNMNAFALLDQMQAAQDCHHVLFLLLSYPHTLSEKQQNNGRGFYRFLTKPIRPVEIINSLMEYWETWKLEHPRHQDANHTPLSVLLVEDDLLAQRVTTLMLRELGCQVDIAGNGRSALERIQIGNQYDVIFMDVGLPDINGIAVTEMIRGQETSISAIPIVALTGHLNEDDKAICLQAGMDAVIGKPALQQDFERILTQINQTALTSEPA